MAKKTTSRTLKHPVLNNVEYASIVRNRKSVLEIEGKDIEGLTFRDFQIYVGKKIGVGRFHFTIKFKNNAELYTGSTKAIDPDVAITKDDDSTAIIKQVTDAFKSLESKLNNATQQGGITYEMLLGSVKQGYETQINFLNQQIVYKDGIIVELKTEIKELNNELDQAEVTIRQLEQKAGYNQYLEPISKILIAKFGTPKPVNLKDSDPSGIPLEVLEVLGIIDYQKINPEDLNKMVELLRQYISATGLPLKGQ